MPGAVLGASAVVVCLTVGLAALTLAVTAAGAARPRRSARLLAALVAGQRPTASPRALRSLVEELAATWGPGDLRRLLPADAGEQLRVAALRQLTAPSWRTRLAAARLLLAVGPREPVIRLLTDPVDVVRAMACAGVGPGTSAEALDAVARLLDDPAPGVRHAAAEALARCGAPAGAALARLLALEPPSGVRAVALSLAVPGAAALLPYADAAAAAPDPEVRRAAAGALAALGDPLRRLPVLVADADPVVAAAACRAAAALGDPSLARALSRALESPSWDVRTCAAAALAALGPAGALLLRMAANGPDAYARDAALSALGLAAVPAGA